MKFPSRESSDTSLPGISGTARVDRRTEAVTRRVRRGDVAVIDHLDLDRGSAEALVQAGVAAVVNASSFISGRYPNLGPQLLSGAGVVLVDAAGPEVLRAIRDGATVRVHQGRVYIGEREVASGEPLSPEQVEERMQSARGGLSTQLQSLAHNTSEFLRREQDLLLHGKGVPELRTSMTGRPVVVVVRAYDHLEDLRRLRRFIREQRPVLVGVDAGADALLAAGHRPDVVVVGERGLGQGGPAGEPGQDVVSDEALRSAREVVEHTDRSGRAGGDGRLQRLGIRSRRLPTSGTSEDVALLLADASDAALVVAVGTHATLDEMLDAQRGGLASTFLTRLKLGATLVDAKAVERLYTGRVRLWHLAVVLLAGVLALAVALASTPLGAAWWGSVQDALTDLLAWIQGLLT